MIPERLWPLLSKVIGRLSTLPSLHTVVLFGSAARGDLTEASDIDLLLVFDVPHNPETGGELESAHRALGSVDTGRRLQLVATNLGRKLDPDFLGNVAREGVVVFGRPLVLTTEDLHLRPHEIYTYSVAGLPQAGKTRLQRALSGYRVTRRIGGKEYVSEKEGSLKLLGARKLGKGVAMVPEEGSAEFGEVLDQHGIRHVKVKVWC